MHRLSLVMLVVLLSVASPVSAQTPAFLPTSQAVGMIADGHPWSAQTGDGKSMTITFNRDGSASLKGPMPFPMSASWQVKGENFCVDGPMGVKCVRFRQVAGGFEGWIGNAVDLQLTR